MEFPSLIAKKKVESESHSGAIQTRFGGVSCVAGLVWTSVDGRSHKAPRRKNTFGVTWAGRYAELKGVLFKGQPPLLALIVDQLSDEDRSGTILLAYSDGDVFVSAVLTDGRPVLMAEDVFETEEDLIDHIRETAAKGVHARIVHSAALADLLEDIETTCVALPEAQLDPRDFPRFEQSGPLLSKPAKNAAAAVLILGGAFTLGLLYIDELQTAFKGAQEEIPTAKFTEDFEVFASGCEGAFSDAWPSAPGWELEQEGCASPMMEQATVGRLSQTSGVAFQVHRLKPGHNEVLARRVAAQIYSDWPQKLKQGRGKLVVFKEFDVPMVRAPKTPEGLPPLIDRVEEAFFGVAESITNRQGGTNLDGRTTGSVDIITKASLKETLRRMSLIPSSSLRTMSRRDQVLTIKIGERKDRLMPIGPTGEPL